MIYLMLCILAFRIFKIHANKPPSIGNIFFVFSKINLQNNHLLLSQCHIRLYVYIMIYNWKLIQINEILIYGWSFCKLREREREKRIVTYCLNFIDVFFCLFIFLNFELFLRKAHLLIKRYQNICHREILIQ